MSYDNFDDYHHEGHGCAPQNISAALIISDVEKRFRKIEELIAMIYNRLIDAEELIRIKELHHDKQACQN